MNNPGRGSRIGEGNINIGSIRDIRPWGGEFNHPTGQPRHSEVYSSDSSPFDANLNSSPRADTTTNKGGRAFGGGFGGHFPTVSGGGGAGNNSPRGGMSNMNSMGKPVGNVGNIARMVDSSHRNINSIVGANRTKEWQYLTYSSSNLTPTKKKFPNDFFLLGARPLAKQPHH